MFIEQLSVFMENKKGRLSALTQTLAEANVDLVALSIADTADYGIMRAIVNDTKKALIVLKEAGYTVSTTKVLAVAVPDKPGGLALVLQALNAADISVEYLYSFVRNQGDQALILFKVGDGKKAVQALTDAHIRLLSQEQVASL